MTYQRIEYEDPTIVLTYVGSGFPQLRTVLELVPEMEWVPGANLVQLCERLAVEWRIIDDTPDGISALARQSIKTTLQTMVASRLVRGGKRRWCGTAIGDIPGPGSSFAALYPRARFITLHRRCADAIYSGIAACPWGLSGSGYGYEGFAAAHAGNSVAALADYWATHTALMIDFETACPDRCLRIRYEDLVDDPQKTGQAVCEFLDVTPPAGVPDLTLTGAAAVGCGSDVPVSRIPPYLAERADKLSRRLRYDTLSGRTP